MRASLKCGGMLSGQRTQAGKWDQVDAWHWTFRRVPQAVPTSIGPAIPTTRRPARSESASIASPPSPIPAPMPPNASDRSSISASSLGPNACRAATHAAAFGAEAGLVLEVVQGDVDVRGQVIADRLQPAELEVAVRAPASLLAAKPQIEPSGHFRGHRREIFLLTQRIADQGDDVGEDAGRVGADAAGGQALIGLPDRRRLQQPGGSRQRRPQFLQAAVGEPSGSVRLTIKDR